MRPYCPRVALLTVLATALILPYAITAHTYPIPTFYAEFTAFALYLTLGAGLALFLRSADCRPPFAVPATLLTLLAFSAVLLAQIVLLPLQQPSINWLALGYLLAALIALQTGYSFTAAGFTDAVARVMGTALIIGAGFAVFCQIVQLFHWETTFTPFVMTYAIPTQRRPFGNLAQTNHLATYLAFGLASALYLVQTRRLPIWAWALISALLAAGLTLTGSRGPWLQVAVLALAGSWMALADKPRDLGANIRAWLVPGALILLFVALNVVTRWANLHYQLGLGESAADRMQNAGQFTPRLALWRYGLAMFDAHRLLGVGWGGYPGAQYALAPTLGNVEIANNAHNIFIDLLAKTGVAGTGVVVLGFGMWCVRALRAPHTCARIFGFALLGVLLIHALVEYPQQYAFFLLPAMFVIGLLETKSLAPTAAPRALGVFALSACCGLAALYPVLRDYQRAEVLYYGASPAKQYEQAPSLLFRTWGQYGATTLLPISRDNLSNKLAAHEQALTFLPGETVLRRYAVLLALANRQDEAFDTIKRLRIFAGPLNNWPAQLAALDQLCDTQPALAGFKAHLLQQYGTPSHTTDDFYHYKIRPATPLPASPST